MGTKTKMPKEHSSAPDWPNYQGFDTSYEERTPVELKVAGKIPSWAAGTLFRTGIGRGQIQTDKGVYRVCHWFDGLAVVHRFRILAPDKEHPGVRVIYNSRSTCDGLIEKIRKTGERKAMTFAKKYDPCQSYFKKIMSIFQADEPRQPDEYSMAITLSVDFPGLESVNAKKKSGSGHASGIQQIVNKTDSAVFQVLDPETLEPVGIAKQYALDPELRGPMSAAHAKSDPVTGDVYNFNLEFGMTPTYRVFTVSRSTGKTSILATITNATPAYIHSIFLTENYVVLCVWNSFFAANGVKILWTRNILDAIGEYDPSRPAKWYVVDRRTPENGGRGLVASFESNPFFCFHSVNAYEVPSQTGSGTDIIADLVAYDNLNPLKCFYLDNLKSNSPNAGKTKAANEFSSALVRYRLLNNSLEATREAAQTVRKAVIEYKSEPIQSPELPTMNPRFITRPHRYIYAVNFTGSSTFFDGLVKMDTKTHKSKFWSRHGQSAGEPIFVPRTKGPLIDISAGDDGSDEDDGVLLSVVLDGLSGNSYLLVLDAKTMTEVGRAEVNGAIGFGFHGIHVRSDEQRGLDL
ncbi:carotenoid cleavage dioxygenase 1 [Nannizzia gypsea CBS 118893]|uniref:Carotenoid cleavage dioxygenase 1 n=1 Tax=Arthroderma gypseum (strain ATCC MYA-4604 / CBS 118893) TaxID=535722 RepID=E4V2H8_ARTGP|nr:carotenoid cleavage dioxygenase 1 [Nannizzia gypsea CBS 118893]EFR04243.1 carotenoid cleavage dioxygenase 1 [Nannizzia gypsea CBS 118893]